MHHALCRYKRGGECSIVYMLPSILLVALHNARYYSAYYNNESCVRQCIARKLSTPPTHNIQKKHLFFLEISHKETSCILSINTWKRTLKYIYTNTSIHILDSITKQTNRIKSSKTIFYFCVFPGVCSKNINMTCLQAFASDLWLMMSFVLSKIRILYHVRKRLSRSLLFIKYM